MKAYKITNPNGKLFHIGTDMPDIFKVSQDLRDENLLEKVGGLGELNNQMDIQTSDVENSFANWMRSVGYKFEECNIRVEIS